MLHIFNIIMIKGFNILFILQLKRHNNKKNIYTINILMIVIKKIEHYEEALDNIKKKKERDQTNCGLECQGQTIEQSVEGQSSTNTDLGAHEK